MPTSKKSAVGKHDSCSAPHTLHVALITAAIFLRSRPTLADNDYRAGVGDTPRGSFLHLWEPNPAGVESFFLAGHWIEDGVAVVAKETVFPSLLSLVKCLPLLLS
jgi:hypothetical protein